MRKIILLVMVAALIFGFSAKSPSGMLALAAEDKMGYVDIAKVFDEYGKTKESDKMLEEKGNKKQAERDKMVEEVRKLKDELELLSDKGKEEKQVQIDDKIKKLQDFDRQTRDDLRRERDTAAREIFKEIEKVIQGIGEKEGYNIIINERALVYATKDANLTDKVLEALNKQYTKKP